MPFMPGIAHKIIQCDLEGNELRQFSSAKDAAEWIGVKYPTAIRRAIKCGVVAYGYRWKYAGKELIPLPKATPGVKRRVVAVNLETGRETLFASISEASRVLGIGVSHISNALITGCKGNNYRFFYEEAGAESLSKKPRPCHEILCYGKRGEPKRVFASAKECALALGVSVPAVYRCINAKRSQPRCQGYRLRYIIP